MAARWILNLIQIHLRFSFKFNLKYQIYPLKFNPCFVLFSAYLFFIFS